MAQSAFMLHRMLPHGVHQGSRMAGVRTGHRGVRFQAMSEAAASEVEVVAPTALDVRVGKILSCARHPDADALYVEEIDVGEATPRTICSGLVPYLRAEELMDAVVVVLCNLKARNFRGIKSHGMLLCASDKAAGKVAPLVPPAEAVIGERVHFGNGDLSDPESENKMKKKKIWEKLQPLMQTNNDGVAMCNGQAMHVPSGNITTSLTNAPIS